LVSSEIALRLRGIRASYGARDVLDGIDLDVASGEVLALLGHNGAGKTTALRVVVGLKRPEAGTVCLLGHDIARLRCSARARAGLALVPEGAAGIFPTLTVRQNLAAATPAGRSGVAHEADIESKLEAAFGEVLVDRADQIAGSMSGGQRQMLAISLALIRRPSVLLLDEPSTGLAPAVVQRIFSVVADLSDQTGTAVVIVEQDVAAALKIATRIVILQSGKLVVEYSRETCPPATELWRYF
jgi:branched-chain amino acid transport system ATP-binding protein